MLNSGDPQPCTTGYLSSAVARSPGAVTSEDVSGWPATSSTASTRGGNAVDETGSDIRGAQNIGADGGVASPGPGASVGSALGAPLDDLLGSLLGGLLHATPFTTTAG